MQKSDVELVRGILFALFVAYFGPQIIFKYSHRIRSFLLFMNRFGRTDKNLSKLVDGNGNNFGLKRVRSLRLRHSDEAIEIGVWHILPESRLAFGCNDDDDEEGAEQKQMEPFDDQRPIVFYVHGNKGTRAGEHRLKLYRRLAYEFDFHVIAFDFRGFGDSTDTGPTSKGVTCDTQLAYNWLLEQPNVHPDRVFVWAHSLGTGLAIKVISDLPECSKPSGLILEAPFDSIANAIANHPFSRPFKLVPKLFEHFIVDPIERSNDELNSLKHLPGLKSTRVIILHAEDDPIIPLRLGKNLYEKAAVEIGKDQVDFVQISAQFNLGHRYICDHNETMARVERFINQARELV